MNLKIKFIAAITLVFFLVQTLIFLKFNETNYDKESKYTNVKTFGAKGNGKDDDTKAIQNAIIAAKDTGVLVFPKGNYIVSHVSFKSDIEYIGQGTTISAKEISTPVTIQNVSNIKIEGIIFDSKNRASKGLEIQSSTNIKIVNCTFKNALNFGLYTEVLKDSIINNSLAIHNGNKDFHDAGFSINGENVAVTDSIAKDNNANGIRIFGTDSFIGGRITISNVHLHHNSNHGLLTTPIGKIQNSPSHIFISNSIANNNGTKGIYSGFAVHYSSQSTVQNSLSYENEEHGFVLMDNSFGILKGNIARKNGVNGIRIQADWNRNQDVHSGVHDAIISDNVILGNGVGSNAPSKDGISIEGNNYDLQIKNNNISQNLENGINIKTRKGYKDSYNIFIEGNMLNENKLNRITNESLTEKRIYGENIISGKNVELE
ncbi:right-handed parallel beta-helix repeat-containing protein [Mesobacillus foraminis]|uniref:right-handed parallel beta-helix repeat-containing protein n=1 Tax=Mesobacillus foraminis TaxID=279826 RepID=UPI001BE597B1|nr:right-handed parallel beta-helix repeat-containing protein [Mesobacillus foraminis]MBT2756716.1 right-handed parallel beta-helix repeat-containing protein [Mesobacillus foraminis]